MSSIKDLGITTGTAKFDTKEIVERKVYELTESVETITHINTEVLKIEKIKLQKRITEIDNLLTKMSD